MKNYLVHLRAWWLEIVRDIISCGVKPAVQARAGRRGLTRLAFGSGTVLLFLMLTGNNSLPGATVTLNPAADAYVNDSAPNNTFNNAWLVAGHSPAEFTPRYRSFLRFSLSGIPSNALVGSAVLRLNLQAVEGGSATAIELRRVLATWSSTTLTWNSQPATTTPVTTTTVGAALGADYSWSIASLAQGWVSGQYSNAGLALFIANEATANATRTFASGNHATTSIRPELVVTYALPPDIAVTPAALPFGNQLVGTTSVAQNVTVLNNGGSTLWISNVTSSSSQFLLTLGANLPVTILPGDSLPFGVRFAPTSVGVMSGSVTVLSDDPDEPVRAVSCTGNGAAPRIAVTPQSLVFSNVIIGTTARRDLKLKNDGNANLIISNMTGTNPVFRLEGLPSFPLALAPAQELTVAVVYSPLSARQDFDRIRIGSSDPFSPEVFVEMGGAGEPPDCEAAGPLPLHITVNSDDDRKAWNVERDGVRFWNFEDHDYTVSVSDRYPVGFAVTLDRSFCSDHFSFYYTTNDATHSVTRSYVQEMATLLEDAWQALFVVNGFRAPTDLQDEGRYSTFENFIRIPVLIFIDPDPDERDNNHAGGGPTIHLKPALPANSSRPLHELFHLMHHGYTSHGTNWFREGIARWAQKFEPRDGPVCDDLDLYRPLTHDFLMRSYCETAPFFEYLGQKYGRESAGSDGSDVIKRFFEELGEVGHRDTYGAMLGMERALDHFAPLRASGVGNAFAEWAVGNYADDTLIPAQLRIGAPLIPRYKEGGRIGGGGDQYLFREYSFCLARTETVTIQVRASANVPDGADPGDDDDLRVLLDGEVLAGWNSTDGFDGETLLGRLRTVHLIKPELAAGVHTLRLEGDEHLVLYSLTVFEGEVPLLVQSSPEARPMSFLNTEAFSTNTFATATNLSNLTVYLTGVAQSAAQNQASDDNTSDEDNTRLELDGSYVTEWHSNEDLDGDALEGDLATVEVHLRGVAGVSHTLTMHVDGRPLIREIVVFPTPERPPLLQARTPSLVSWSAGYQVAPVTQALIDSGDALEFQLSTIQWGDDLTPPFSELLQVGASDTLVEPHPRQQNFGTVRGLSADCIAMLGAGGRLVHVTTATSIGGTYELMVTRVGSQPDRYDRAHWAIHQTTL